MCNAYLYKCTGMLQPQIARDLAPEAETERSLQLSRGQRSEAGGPELEGVQCGHGEGPIVLLCLPWSVSFHSHSCCLIITRWGLLYQAHFHLSGRKKGKGNSSRCLLYQQKLSHKPSASIWLPRTESPASKEPGLRKHIQAGFCWEERDGNKHGGGGDKQVSCRCVTRESYLQGRESIALLFDLLLLLLILK